MKWIVLLLCLGVGVYGAWAYLGAHPQMRACAHFAELCGDDARKQCDDAFDALAKTSGADALAPSAACVRDATSCPQATGCIVGAAGKAGLKAAGEFFKGLGESIGK